MIQLPSLGTKELSRHRPRLKDPCRRTAEPEPTWSPCKPRGRRDITVYLLSDFALIALRNRSHVEESGTSKLALLHPTS